MHFDFDAPPAGTDFEGIPGSGDSGGPALLDIDGKIVVAGVSSLGEPGAAGPGTYGARDYFGRVSTHLPWLRRALAGDESEYHSAPAGLPDGPVGERMAALLALVRQGSSADVDAFVREHMSDEPGRSAAHVQALRSIVQEFAGAVLERVDRAGPDGIDAVVRTAGGPRLLGLHLENAAPHRIIGVLTGRLD